MNFICMAIKESYSGNAKAFLRITKNSNESINQITTIKLSIINCLAFLNRMIRIVLIVKIIISRVHY